MLGQLFNSPLGILTPRRTQTRQPSHIESATEDAHTRSLIFPDASLFPNPLSSSFDSPGPQSPGPGYDGIHGDIDLEHSRDIRIIIAQDEVGSSPRTVLYDSKQNYSRAEPPKTFSGRTGRHYAAAHSSANQTSSTSANGHSRRSSVANDAAAPRSPGVGAFHRRSRASSISSMPAIDQLSLGRNKEVDMGIQNTCLECMFGNISMGYKGTGNKLHIIPLESRAIDQSLSSYATEGQGSLPRGEARRRSNLARSYTPSNIPPEFSAATLVPPQDLSSKDRRRTVMISRIFSVTLPEEADQSDGASIYSATPQNSLPKGGAYPFPHANHSGTNAPGGYLRRPRSTKLPMYGVSIVMQLPVASKSKATPHVGSFPGPASLGSSADSERRSGWSWVDSNFGVDSFLSASFSSDVDDRVDIIGQHWDIIIRTLTSLQFVVQERVLAHYKASDVASTPLTVPHTQASATSTNPHHSRTNTRDMKLPPTRRTPRLPPSALAFDQDVQKAVRVASERVVRGIKIPRVVTGQNRWGVWREEARWLGNWAGGKEENFFFFTLLTSFLGHHTEWLNVLGPKKYQRLHRKQQRSKGGEDLTISNRTIIVAADKMAARRLIFLLSAFLPASRHAQAYDGASPIRPGTAASGRGYSQSPPHQVGLVRQQSLRRTINRRPKPGQQHPRAGELSKSSTRQSEESNDCRHRQTTEDSRHHSRKTSEAFSLAAFPTLSDNAAGKSTSTITPTTSTDAPQPIAHFARPGLPRTQSYGSNDGRPPSSESVASTFVHTLKRQGTHASNHSIDSQSTGRWSTIMSFWNGGRRSSTADQHDVMQTTDEVLGANGYAQPRFDSLSPPTLQQMVSEAEQLKRPQPRDDVERSYNQPCEEDFSTTEGIPCSGARDIPRRPKSEHEPLKLSVNENDGVIDVDIPIPGFGGSPVQSPLIGGFNHSSSFEDSSPALSSNDCFSYGDSDQPINVAGWLGKFHADFELHGVVPYSELEHDIRKAMSAEPTPITSATTPNLENGPTEKWVDVCTALVADAKAFTVKRLRLRRLVRLVPIPSQPAITPGPFATMPPRMALDPYHASAVAPAMPMSELHLEEKFIEEPVMDIDSTLADAIERVLAQSAQSTRAQSEASSRSNSIRGRPDGRTTTDVPTPPVLEIPRQECKHLVFGALQQVVQSVQDERDRKPNRAKEHGRSTDSTLREGVKRWLTEVE